MNLNLDYSGLIIILKWFIGIGLFVGLGLVFLRRVLNSEIEDFLDPLRAAVEILTQVIKEFRTIFKK
jgi:hypothetical protein